jgi:hypothetical protein
MHTYIHTYRCDVEFPLKGAHAGLFVVFDAEFTYYV